VVSEVARRHEISPQHLFAWRKAARAGQLAAGGRDGGDVRSGDAGGRASGCCAAIKASITIEIAVVVVRAECGVDGSLPCCAR
jgi:transposase